MSKSKGVHQNKCDKQDRSLGAETQQVAPTILSCLTFAVFNLSKGNTSSTWELSENTEVSEPKKHRQTT